MHIETGKYGCPVKMIIINDVLISHPYSSGVYQDEYENG